MNSGQRFPGLGDQEDKSRVNKIPAKKWMPKDRTKKSHHHGGPIMYQALL
jgi:hypothetical protein